METITRPTFAFESEHVYSLARRAECAGPDSDTSPGAEFLTRVRDAVIEAIVWSDDGEYYPEFLTDDLWEHAASEIAADAPNIYTHQLWAEFIDLAAWQVDIVLSREIGMESGARECLEMIAYRLAVDLFADAREEVRDTI